MCSSFLLEFYEDTFTILSECTSVKISPRMWQLLQLVYETFQRDTIDYFTGRSVSFQKSGNLSKSCIARKLSSKNVTMLSPVLSVR